jgi:hypothetical protein
MKPSLLAPLIEDLATGALTASRRGRVFDLVPRSLREANPGYHDIGEITRLFAAGAPVHMAAHWIDGAQEMERDYSCNHAHEDVVEVNILLGEPGGLFYNVVLAEGEEPVLIESPRAVIVPSGVVHSANVVRGRGWFVVLRLPAAAVEE